MPPKVETRKRRIMGENNYNPVLFPRSIFFSHRWQSEENTDKGIFHTEMHRNIESPKNRFIARCNYFSNKKNNNSLKGNTSEINILDENIKDIKNARTNSIYMHIKI
jgi:hypothetical protein